MKKSENLHSILVKSIQARRPYNRSKRGNLHSILVKSIRIVSLISVCMIAFTFHSG